MRDGCWLIFGSVSRTSLNNWEHHHQSFPPNDTRTRNRISPCILAFEEDVPVVYFRSARPRKFYYRVLSLIPRDEEPNTNWRFFFLYRYIQYIFCENRNRNRGWISSERYGLVVFCGRRRVLSQSRITANAFNVNKQLNAVNYRCQQYADKAHKPSRLERIGFLSAMPFQTAITDVEGGACGQFHFQIH